MAQFSTTFPQMAFALPYVLGAQVVFWFCSKVPNHPGAILVSDTRKLLVALAPTTAVLFALRISLDFVYSNYHPYLKLPLGIILIHYTLSVLGLCLIRGFRRTLHEKAPPNNPSVRQNNVARVLLGCWQCRYLGGEGA